MKYALILANNKYEDSKLAQLKTPEADARALTEVLKAKNIGNFDEVKTLINPSEVRSRRAINAFLANKKPDDLVLVYFSGHGVLDDRGSLFLAVKDTEIGSLSVTAIPSNFISSEMDNCRSRRQILILDCCHSGAFARGAKGEQKAITQSTFEGSGSGRVVLTASDSTELAFEGDRVIGETKLSLFTHFLLEGLKTGEADLNNDGRISLDEWYDYCHSRITATTPKQIPHKWSYRQQGDLIIANNPFRRKQNAGGLSHPLREMLDQKLLDYRQHKLLLDARELDIINAELEQTDLELGVGDKRLFLFSALASGEVHKWLELCGPKGPEWLREACKDETFPQAVRLGAVAHLGRSEDLSTYDYLLECVQHESNVTGKNDDLELLTHYLNNSEESRRLPWSVRWKVFPRIAWLRVKDGLIVRVRTRKTASYIAPICVLIMMVPVSTNPSIGQPDYAGFTFILAFLSVFSAYIFAETMTSIILITKRWPILLQAAILGGVGSLLGTMLFYILSGHGGLWFEGGFTGLIQMIMTRGSKPKSLWYARTIAFLAGFLVFLASLQVINDSKWIKYGAALSTGLFTAVYSYTSRRRE